MPPSAMSGMPGIAWWRGSFGDGGDLRHAGAGDHAGGADRPGTDADFDAIDAGSGQFAGAVVGGDVAGDQFALRATSTSPS